MFVVVKPICIVYVLMAENTEIFSLRKIKKATRANGKNV
jgi:hypothetical protein